MKIPVLVAALSIVSANADADVSKAWAAAKDNLPANTKAIGAIDVAAVVKTTVYAKLLELVVREEKEIGPALAMVKQTCGIDPMTVVEGLVVAGDPEPERGIVFLQHSLDRKKVSTCITDLLKLMGEKKVTVKDDGKFIVIGDGKFDVRIAWVTANVAAIAIKPDQKAEYDKWLGGKGALAKSKLAAQLEKLDTKAIAFGALAVDKPFDDNDLPVLSATGTVTVANKTATLKLRGTTADAKSAGAMHAKMRKDIDKDIQRGKTPPALMKLMKAVKLTHTGSDVTFELSATEADLNAAVDSIK